MPAVEIADRPLCGLAICHPDMDASEMAEKLARAGLDVTQTAMTYSTANLLNIAPAGIDKSTGVSRALRILAVAPADTIAFGDMPDDLPMFRLCG